METELFASVEAGDLDKFKELIKKETKETIDQVIFSFCQYAMHTVLNTEEAEIFLARVFVLHSTKLSW